MTLTRKQEEGLRRAVEGYKIGEPYVCISGYAGSGKSTLVKFIVAALGLDPELDVCYVAYTGKAATVLRQKGCANAMTAHKLLYWASRGPTGKYTYKPRPSIEYKVIIVDEVSMLPATMWQRLLSHKKFIIALGDPGQLPPVVASEDNHVLDNPHVFLDEIMRQALDSEIIRLSMHIREGRPLSAYQAEGAQVQIYKPNDFTIGMCNWADQIICSTNDKRVAINKLVRENKGFPDYPVEGDRIISLSNHWEFFSNSGTWPLTNGAIGTLGYNYFEKVYPPRFIHEGKINILYANMTFEDDIFTMIPIDYQYFQTGVPALTPTELYRLSRSKADFEAPYDFTYGYCITCHKAQGSQWDKVLFIEEGFPYERKLRTQLLYTAATRAAEKLVIIRKD